MKPAIPALLALLLFTAAPAQAQTAPPGSATGSAPNPAARCAQLIEFWMRNGGAKDESSGGSSMVLKTAVVDCESGRAEAGIKAIEEMLRQNGYTVPPG